MTHRSTKHLLIIVVLILVGVVCALPVGPPVTRRAIRFDTSLYVVAVKAVAQALGFCLNNDPDCPISPCVATGDRTALPLARCTSEPSR